MDESNIRELMIINNWFIVVMYSGDMFSFRILGYGLRCDRMQPTFVRRMFGHGYIYIGKWDVELLYPRKFLKTYFKFLKNKIKGENHEQFREKSKEGIFGEDKRVS